MFDAAKIRNITAKLQKMSEVCDDIFLMPERIYTPAEAALFRRLNIKLRAIIDDESKQKDFCGLPILKTQEAVKKFTESTGIIVLLEKPLKLVESSLDFKVAGGTWTISSIIMSVEETKFIYDRLTLLQVEKQYKEDGLLKTENTLLNLAENFARAFTTSSDSRYQNVKINLYDSRPYYKPTYDFDDTAIVFQGPIEYDDNYTAETFKLYRSIYPNIPIVVSTWKDEATDTFRRECKENSIVLLENDMPEERAYGNINLQLKSSFEGVKYIKENTSAKFVLKTRTDQRMYYFDFLVYFKNLLDSFPPKGDKLNQRIILFGSETVKKYPFNFHDFLAFGHINDISRLYGIPLHGKTGKLDYKKNHVKRVDKIGNLTYKNYFDYNTVTEQSHKLFKLNRAMNRIYWPEVYLMRTFYEKYIAPVDASKLFETSWKFTVDYLILIDFESVHLDWSKYESMRYNPKFAFGSQCVFSRWLDMYQNFKIDWV